MSNLLLCKETDLKVEFFTQTCRIKSDFVILKFVCLRLRCLFRMSIDITQRANGSSVSGASYVANLWASTLTIPYVLNLSTVIVLLFMINRCSPNLDVAVMKCSCG